MLSQCQLAIGTQLMQMANSAPRVGH